MYKTQTTILYTLNVHSALWAVCQSCLNKPGRKKTKEPENAKLSTIHKAAPLLPPQAGTIQSYLSLEETEKS